MARLLRVSMIPIEAVTDSKCVCLKVSTGEGAKVRPVDCAWASPWEIFRDLLGDFGGRGPRGLEARKVKAHLALGAVVRGKISRQDRLGN